MDEPLPPKPARASYVEMTEIVLPSHTNPLGTAFGGQVMAWIDICAGIAAARHARRVAVTASMDDLHFRSPLRLGEVAVLKAQVNRAWHTSMEVGVRVEAENPLTGERRHCSSAYLTFVALDEHGQRVPIPPVLPETEDERRRYAEAEERRRMRLERRNLRRDVVDR
ncbi:MAG: acyl-CoA thioesterase [Anaerolineae bacterium]|nr:acyl-CoA thioesterase [Caldilineales bacterium]MCX7851181.1 acyl-CoA thioesterase [Caldilineales bacterium]MDW8270677.1 acyl-CoA thioesterase [Anaerolineae bacterium]